MSQFVFFKKTENDSNQIQILFSNSVIPKKIFFLLGMQQDFHYTHTHNI